VLAALAPAILLLAFDVAACHSNRAGRLSPIVRYLVLGAPLRPVLRLLRQHTVQLLAKVGAVFLLFIIGSTSR